MPNSVTELKKPVHLVTQAFFVGICNLINRMLLLFAALVEVVPLYQLMESQS